MRLAGSRPVPTGFPINVLYPYITITDSALACSSCGTSSTVPSPRDVHAYNRAAEMFLSRHKSCSGGAR